MRINKYTIVLMLFFTMLFSSVFMITSVHSAENQEIENLNSSQMLSGPIRIAIYDDANTTVPSYSGSVTLTNNYSNIQTALLAAGYEVTPLSTNQIYNHELKTARYDVFIMADHMPKVNITNFVNEYWLGGGALLSMDSALSFICYAGILPPESAGDDGFGIYWDYIGSTVQNITTRHPVSKSYQVNDTFTISGPTNSATPDWTALQGTSIASELVKIATLPGYPDDATVVGYDPQSRGGKVVHIVNHRDLEDDAILIDAIEWLCPKPKGRILFDLSHENGYGVDLWDNDFTHYTDNRYTIMRNNLVSRDYTFDKLYPTGADTFTMQNLSPYDLLIVNLPDTNVSASEVTTLSNWVSSGGNLLALGDQYSFDGSKNLNYLFSPYDLKLINDNAGPTQDTSFKHPTIEGCTTLTMAVPSEVNYSADAYPLWGSSTTDIGIAGQEYGDGRIVLIADINIFDNTRISATENLQFCVNLANWLTASDAKVLIVIGDHFNPDPNDNVYRGPVARALNDLRINFYLTFTCSYFNLSLVSSDWDLVIVDEVVNIGYIDNYASDIINYMDNGGHLIIWSYRQQYASPLWDYLGYTYEGTTLSTPPVVYIWDTDNPIFSTPVQYGANNVTTSLNPFGTDFVNVTLHNNATGIAGLTSTSTVDSNAIILGVNGRAISNTFGLSEYYDDTDDSTYPDGLEIWTNEIAYMWAKIHPGTTTSSIPGYDVLILFSSISLTIGLIAIITMKKKRLSH